MDYDLIVIGGGPEAVDIIRSRGECISCPTIGGAIFDKIAI